MNLPSQEILDDIKELITEITGFQENDENFGICERYCLSHVVHHSYPFVNKSTVKELVNSYESRFYGQGHFKVSQELNHQVKKFLSHEKLFEKNPQYDIQWIMLSLVGSLSSNLTSVKEIPTLLPIDEEESKREEINWGEYLKKDLPKAEVLSSDSEMLSGDEDEKEVEEETHNELCQGKSKTKIIYDNKMSFNKKEVSEERRRRFQEFLNSRKCIGDVEDDIRLKGNISEKFDQVMSQEGINRTSQILSEAEMMENILYQFQTGEKHLLRKGLHNPALMSLTQETLGDYLDSLQPYFKIIKNFKDFDEEVSAAKYPKTYEEKSFYPTNESTPIRGCGRQRVSNVVYTYSVVLRRALEPFENEVAEIADNLGKYTLIKMERKLRPYLFQLASLNHVHNLATENWKEEPNWLCSIRILSVLYNAIMDATCSKMSFLYLNLFLRCFQVYLDLIDLWISCVDLVDLNDEFIVAKSRGKSDDSSFTEFEIRPYKPELEKWGVKEIFILDYVGEKMIHVGQSLEVLRRLNRFVYPEDENRDTSYHLLVADVNAKISALRKVAPFLVKTEPQEKKRSIFTIKSSALLLTRDDGGGDCWEIDSLLGEVLKSGDQKEEKKMPAKSSSNPCKDFIYSTVRNPFFKKAFDEVGLRNVERKLEEAKARKEGEGNEAFRVVKREKEDLRAVYPFHKIISESFYLIFEARVSDACALVKSIILKECELLSHLKLLRSVLLFNDAYLINPFILAFFTQPVIWGSSYSLTLHLKECVKGLYENHADALSVNLSKENATGCDNVLKAIDLITINYEVKWPLTLIFTAEVMEKYNELFRVALKLKWAHWALSGIHLRGEDENQAKVAKSTRHRIQLLRFWLLSALGRIINYYMAQMMPWNVELDACEDFKEIINAHLNFLSRIHSNCLLGEKSTQGRNLVFQKLIPLCATLWAEWTRLEKGRLSAMEKTFRECQLQLSRLMSSLEKE